MKFAIRDLGAVGLVSDRQGHELPTNAFSAADNVRFGPGGLESCEGASQVSLPDVAMATYWIGGYSTNTTRYIVYGGLAAVYVNDGTTATDITGTAPTGAIDDRWTGGVLTGNLVLNNGVDLPMFWNGNTATNLATLTGWDANWKCKAMRPFKNFLIAMNVTKSTTNYPHLVKWSDSADPGAIPGSWDETSATNDAGEVEVAETQDVLVDGLPLGDTFVLYKERSMYGMQLIGGNDIFRFWRMPGESGMLARGCGAQTPKGHVVLTSGDVVLHNGQGTQSIVNGRARDWLFDSMDTTYYKRSFVVSHIAKNEVWVCFPESGQTTCTKALVWNWETNALSTRDLPSLSYAASLSFGAVVDHWDSNITQTWDANSVPWGSSVALDANKESLLGAYPALQVVMSLDNGLDGFGALTYQTATRYGIQLDEDNGRYLVRALWPRIEASDGSIISFYVAGTERPDETPTFSGAQSFTAGTTTKLDFLVSGRYLHLKIQSRAQIWRLGSLVFDVEKQGAW